jgi:hypothetical protein
LTLKLAAAFIVDTPFYLVMDSDVYARRPFERADLFDAATGTRARADVPAVCVARVVRAAALLEGKVLREGEVFTTPAKDPS